MKQIIVAILIAIFGPVVAFAMFSFTPALIVSLIIVLLEGLNIFGLCFGDRLIHTRPKFIEKATPQQLTEVLITVHLVATHLLEDDILQRYPGIKKAVSKTERDYYCMGALLRLFMFKITSRSKNARALNILVMHAQQMFPGPMTFTDELLTIQENMYPNGSMGELSRRKFGGNLELCMISFVSLLLAEQISPSESDVQNIANMLAPKLRQFTEHL